MKSKVILTHPFTERQMNWLRERVQLIIAQDYPSIAAAADANPDTQGLISFLSDTIDESVLNHLPMLRVIANYAVGYNNIDIRRAVGRGVRICNTPDVLTDATADLTLALLLAACRRIVEADRFVRDGRFTGWGATLMLGKQLRGSVLGIVGLGRIGTAVAERVRAFGMKVIYFSPSSKKETESRLGVVRVSWDELLDQSDVISLHLPYHPKVYHLFDGRAFARMKTGSIFLNVSRGQLMDETALLEALKSGQLFAAGLDVYEREPRITPELLACERIVLTPHIGSATDQTRERMAQMVCEDVVRVLAGQEPKYPIPG